MSGERSIWEVVRDILRALVYPVEEAANRGEAGIADLVKSIGGGDADVDVVEAIADVAAQLGNVADVESGSEPGLEEIISSLRSVFDALDTISNGLPRDFGEKLLEFLICHFLWREAPRTYATLSLIGAINDDKAPGDRLDLARLGYLFAPSSLMQDVYGWGTANFISDKLLHRVADLATTFGADVDYRYLRADTHQIVDSHGYATGDAPPRVLFAPFFSRGVGDAQVSIGFAAMPVSGASPTDAGIAVVPVGTGGFPAIQLDSNWAISFEAQGGGGYAAVVRPSGINVEKIDPAALSTGFKAKVTRSAASPWNLQLGSGFEIGAEALELAVAYDLGAARTFDASFSITGFEIVISTEDGDGFLAKVLPPDGMRSRGDFRITWSPEIGFYISGGVGISISIPLHQSLGPIVLSALGIGVRLEFGEQPAIEMEGTVDASVEIGPIAASITRVGITARIEMGNAGDDALVRIGPVGIDLGFRPPDGIGAVVDAGAVTGGGYIERLPDGYAGILQLDFSSIGLVAIALISTKMPDGSKGFSMMINIGVTFNPPFQLAMGFALGGVGGLIGIHRSVNVDVLRDGIRKKTLDSILFPEDAIKNAEKIISDMRAVFPPQQGRFVVGPMVKITWGLQLLQIDLGVIIEVPSPVRIIILGQVAALIPTPEAAIVELHLDVLGVIDFAKQELTVDITIYDSRILILELYGDGAIFLGWGSPAQFLMSLGGWHPKFSPPARFADLRRLTIEMKVGSVLHLSFKIYQALTSNTLQFGTRFDLLVNLEAIRIEGYFGFDALFYFSPFSFDASMAAGVSIKVFGETLAAIHLELALSGPTPWHANGLAKFEILWWELEAKIDKTWGDNDAARLDAINPLPELLDAVGKAANWSGVLAGGAIAVEALRELSATATETDEELVYAHPAGALEIRQRVLPLDIELSKFNSAPIKDYNRFDIQAAGAFTGIEAPVQDQFARAQFDDVSNAQKLSIPSYEKFKAGIAVGAEAVDHGVEEPGTFEFEAILLDDLAFSEEELTEIWQDAPPPLVGKLPSWRAARLLMAGAVARAGALDAGNMKFAVRGRAPDVAVVDEAYSIADTDDLGRAAGSAARYGSRTAADQALGADAEGAQVVLEHEVAA